MQLNAIDLSSQDLNAPAMSDQNRETLGALIMRVTGTFSGGLAVTTLLAAAFHHT